MSERLATTAVALVLAALPAYAEDAPKPAAVTQANAAAPPSASDLLFDQPQMKNTAPGSTITYDYLRRSGISSGPFGAPLEDTVALKVEPGKSPEARDISRHDVLGPEPGAGRALRGHGRATRSSPCSWRTTCAGLAKVLEANPRYLKLAIRKGLREKAVVTPTKVTFGGHEVDGWRVVTKPFAGDAMAQRMRGMDDMTYTFVTAPSVPGEIVSIEASSKSAGRRRVA